MACRFEKVVFIYLQTLVAISNRVGMENYPRQYLYKRIVQAKRFIDTHYSALIDLDTIADEACFSKFHFVRLFKTIYGQTPHRYLTCVRITKAKEFLQNGHSVTETCFDVGLDSVSSFATRFKQHTGFSPSGYQQRYKKQQQQLKNSPLQFIPACFAEKGRIQKSNFEEVC